MRDLLSCAVERISGLADTANLSFGLREAWLVALAGTAIAAAVAYLYLGYG